MGARERYCEWDRSTWGVHVSAASQQSLDNPDVAALPASFAGPYHWRWSRVSLCNKLGYTEWVLLDGAGGWVWFVANGARVRPVVRRESADEPGWSVAWIDPDDRVVEGLARPEALEADLALLRASVAHANDAG